MCMQCQRTNTIILKYPNIYNNVFQHHFWLVLYYTYCVNQYEIFSINYFTEYSYSPLNYHLCLILKVRVLKLRESSVSYTDIGVRTGGTIHHPVINRAFQKIFLNVDYLIMTQNWEGNDFNEHQSLMPTGTMFQAPMYPNISLANASARWLLWPSAPDRCRT